MVISLDDDEMEIVTRLSRRLEPPERSIFLQELATRLASHREHGAGLVYRLCRTLLTKRWF
jgi:hypothetical protein